MSRENVVPVLVMVDLIDMPHIEDDVKEEKRDQRYAWIMNEHEYVFFFFLKEWVCMDDDRKTHKVNNKSPVLHSLHYPAHLHLFVAPTININMHGYLTKIHTMILSLDMFVYFFFQICEVPFLIGKVKCFFYFILNLSYKDYLLR